MDSKPLEIKKLQPDGLEIKWSNGSKQFLTGKQLRTNCPCASCRQARGDDSHASPLTPKKSLLKIVESSIDEQTGIKEVWPVGNYAIGIRWLDGHDTGIYSFDYLRELTTPI
jgi:DUF971 family protein